MYCENQLAPRKYKFIYKVTNLINKKIYIGQHATDNIKDGYRGSGVALKNAFKNMVDRILNMKFQNFIMGILKLSLINQNIIILGNIIQMIKKLVTIEQIVVEGVIQVKKFIKKKL